MRRVFSVHGVLFLVTCFLAGPPVVASAFERPLTFDLLPQITGLRGLSGSCRGSFSKSRLVVECSHSVPSPSFASLCLGEGPDPRELRCDEWQVGSSFRLTVPLNADQTDAMLNGQMKLIVESSQRSKLSIAGAVRGDLIFADGFEMGEICRWSASAPDPCPVIFVAKWGDDAFDGSIYAPKLTIQSAIDVAALIPMERVFVSFGGYDESIELAADVGVYGGFNGDFSLRDPALYEVFIFAQGPSPSAPGAVNGIDISGGGLGVTTFDGFTVFAQSDFGSAASSSYGIYLRDVDSSVHIANNEVHAASGADGPRGVEGVDGQDGLAGSPGMDALDLFDAYGVSDHSCLTQHHSPGGTGALGLCGDIDSGGGNGGERICPAWDGDATLPPVASEAGSDSGAGASGGAAGWDVYHQVYSCLGYNTYGEVEGQDGQHGLVGLEGPQGAACPFSGTVEAGLWAPAICGNGGHGGSGVGGGGGGAGAGAWVHDSCFGDFGSDNLGGTGGGGAGGGCYASGGQGGSSGGGSFAVFAAFTVPPVELPEIAGNTLFTGDGGRGGDGGHGGSGGRGGLGGTGGLGGGEADATDSTFPSFIGGMGGDGGNGGSGGGGGGGDGGPSYGIYAHNIGGLDPAQWNNENTFVLTGSGGQAGQGGYSVGNSGAAGNTGSAAATNF